MADEAGENWVSRLPWVLLGRRTAYQPELDSTSAELVFGTTPAVPGDIIGDPGSPLSMTQIKSLLEELRAMAAQPAKPTSAHRSMPVNIPRNLEKVTHVRVKKAKTRRQL